MTIATEQIHFDDQEAPACRLGADFDYVFTWLDDSKVAIDLTAYTLKMQVKKTLTSTAIVEFINDTNGNFSTDSNGAIVFALTGAETAVLTPGNYLYDLIATSPAGKVFRLLEGQFKVLPRVTV